MRKMILSAIALLTMVNLGMSQVQSNTTGLILAQVFGEGGVLLINETYKDADAAEFDVLQFINVNLNEGRVLINGTLFSDSKTDQINFDSNDLSESELDGVMCESVEVTLKPYLGVEAASTDDLNGVEIARVVEMTAAQEMGLTTDYLIMSFNGLDLISPCDLKMEVANCEVGQTVAITILQNGELIETEITLGAHVSNKITYNICPEASQNNLSLESNSSPVFLADMNIYPNPSEGLTYVHFNSLDQGPVTFYVFDMFGKAIHKEVFENVKGNLRLEYNFVNATEGTYLFAIKQNEQVYNSKVIHLNR